MHPILYTFPDHLFGLPLFGPLGLLFGLWAIIALVVLGRLVYQQGLTGDVLSSMAMLAIVGAAICFYLPSLVVKTDDGSGLPIRGYGVMVLLGVVSGVWLAVHRAQKRGFDVELIFRLALWLFLGGIIGARLFYVIEYWGTQFYKLDHGSFDFVATLKAVLNIPMGGLVIYGALIGGGVAGVLFWLFHRGLPMLKIADVIAPSMALGLGIGRIGCFLNGCCYGSVSDLPWAVSFPEESPPYMRQVGDSRRIVEPVEARLKSAEDKVAAAQQRADDADPMSKERDAALEAVKQAKLELDAAQLHQRAAQPLYVHGIALTSSTSLPIDRSNEPDKSGAEIFAVKKDSEAEKAGLEAGERIIQILEQPPNLPERLLYPKRDEQDDQGPDKEVDVTKQGDATLGAAERALLAIKGEGTKISVYTEDHKAQWTITNPDIAPRSLPVQPTQLYSAIDAVLLCLLLLAFDPFRRRDGEVLALMLTIHPISRFLLESIRTDEPKKYPLPVPGFVWQMIHPDEARKAPFELAIEKVSISQLMSVLILISAVALWAYILLRKPRLDGSDQLPEQEELPADEVDIPPASA